MFPALVAVEQAEQDQHDANRPRHGTNERDRHRPCPPRLVTTVSCVRSAAAEWAWSTRPSRSRSVAGWRSKSCPATSVKTRKRWPASVVRPRSAAQLHHTNIVPVFEVGKDGDVSYYAMQFIQGQGLDLVIDELRRLNDRSQTPEIGPAAERGRREIPVSATATAPPPGEGAPVSFMAQSLLTGRFVAETAG